jgi:hypothetical protein
MFVSGFVSPKNKENFLPKAIRAVEIGFKGLDDKAVGSILVCVIRGEANDTSASDTYFNYFFMRSFQYLSKSFADCLGSKYPSMERKNLSVLFISVTDIISPWRNKKLNFTKDLYSSISAAFFILISFGENRHIPDM